MRIAIIVIALVAICFVAYQSLFTVEAAEFAYVTQFGRHVVTFDGDPRGAEAGLHGKWPWPIQTVQRLDRRLQYFDLPVTELLTHNPDEKTIDKTLTIEAYVCWRIPDTGAVDRFIRRVGTPDRAREILGQRINSQLGAMIGGMRMTDLISVELNRVDQSMEELRRKLMDSLKQPALQDYGIELVDIRLRRFNYPAAVRDDIFSRIRSERLVLVQRHKSEGEREAERIRSEAAREATLIRAEATARATELKGEGEAKADSIRNDAHTRDPQFYQFLKKLEEYKNMLGNSKTVLLLSTHGELFDKLSHPPRLDSRGGAITKPETTPSTPGTPTKTGGP